MKQIMAVLGVGILAGVLFGCTGAGPQPPVVTHGYPYATYFSGRIQPVPAGAFTWIARYPRLADLGGGIDVYDVR